MNLLSQFESLLTPKQKGVATITGTKGNHIWIGQTFGGAVVLMYSKDNHATGQKVYYDRISGQIVSLAPDVVFGEFGV